jgi:hypothetical protein
MRPAIVAFAFGVLIFIASTAALALEPPLTVLDTCRCSCWPLWQP